MDISGSDNPSVLIFMPLHRCELQVLVLHIPMACGPEKGKESSATILLVMVHWNGSGEKYLHNLTPLDARAFIPCAGRGLDYCPRTKNSPSAPSSMIQRVTKRMAVRICGDFDTRAVEDDVLQASLKEFEKCQRSATNSVYDTIHLLK